MRRPLLAVAATLAAALFATVRAQDPPPPAPAPTPAPTPTPTPTPTPPATLILPAFTGYAHPDPEALRRRNDGSVAHTPGLLAFYVDLATAGELILRLERTAEATASPPSSIRAQVDPLPVPHQRTEATTRIATTDDFGAFPIPAPGPYRITLQTTDETPLRHLRALHLSGSAAANAHANTAERRNAASVHLGYQVPNAHRADVEWFYVELKPRTDPLWTYYMATGWHRGYFGMQVNSPTERRILFSVWDAGNEPTDRAKVPERQRVQLVAKGDGVHAGDFGNEGTGGHSHWQHDWQLGGTFRFLLHARAEGDTTTYTGWFWLAAEQQWRLIASFRAPQDGKLPHGLYSFSENFHGANGDLARECEYGNAWVRTRGGLWLPLRTALFTHDATGREVRRDRWGGVRGERFYLRHGDFTAPPEGAAVRYGSRLELAGPAGAPPADRELPSPPAAAAPGGK